MTGFGFSDARQDKARQSGKTKGLSALSISGVLAQKLVKRLTEDSAKTSPRHGRA